MLSISADYVSPGLFETDHPTAYGKFGPLDAEESFPDHVSLRTLELTYSGTSSGVEGKITPIDIVIAIDDGTFPALRQVRVSDALTWRSNETREDVEALTDVLQERSKKDWELREGVFADKDRAEYEREEIWRTVSGVWTF